MRELCQKKIKAFQPYVIPVEVTSFFFSQIIIVQRPYCSVLEVLCVTSVRNAVYPISLANEEGRLRFDMNFAVNAVQKVFPTVRQGFMELAPCRLKVAV